METKQMPKNSKNIRKGDRVYVIAGNEKKKIGIVQSRDGDKVVIQGLNVRKKHIKKTQDNPKGRIIDIEMPIHISNVKLCVEGDQ